ncbi:MAG: glycerate kinase [bacterium]|nr:glycerate kinase [bacterium]
MKIIIAPNALKGSLRADDAAAAMADGVRRIVPDAALHCIPVSDGGDGLLTMLRTSMVLEDIVVRVRGPRGAPVDATFCFDRATGTAVIEMAQAAGYVLLAPAQRDPTQTSSYGVGQIIRAAIEHGARRVLLGLGGSATCDGGIGMAAALGVRFTDQNGKELEPIGAFLGQIAHIDVSNMALATRIIGLCDVDNPLHGIRGAAYVFAPQKGATAAQVQLLDAGLAHLAAQIVRDLQIDVAAMPGAGAAGGLGAGVCAFLHGTLQPGADTLLEMIHFDALLAGADLVLTAEGCLDAQSLGGKAPVAVARWARACGIPCIAIAGVLADDLAPLHAAGITAAFSLCRRPLSHADAMRHAAPLLRAATEQVMRTVLMPHSPDAA